MREIQLNNAHFSVMQNSPVGMMGGADEDGEGDGSTAKAAVKRTANDAVPLCYAAQLCFNASKPLFSYWLQLHQHRNMVSTVLDRLIRGFASAAREEFEALTYNCVTMTQENVHSSLVQSTKLDPLYKAYRMKVFGAFKVSVDDLFATSGGSAAASTGDSAKNLARRSFMPQPGATSMQRRSVRGSHSQSAMPTTGGDGGAEMDEAKGRNALEVTVWEQLEYWDVGNHNYPITAQKVRRSSCVDFLKFCR
jgi:hypothetical protein